MQFSCHPFPHHFRCRGAVLGSCWHESIHRLVNATAPTLCSRHTMLLDPHWLWKQYYVYTCSIPSFTGSLAQLMVNTQLPGSALFSSQGTALQKIVFVPVQLKGRII